MRLVKEVARVCVCLAALAVPAVSAAQDTVPEDNSGGSQYLPNVPQGPGAKPEPKVEQKSPEKKDEVPEPAVEELEAASPDGGVAADVAEATAPESDQLERAKARADRRAEQQTKQRREDRRQQRQERQERQEQRQERERDQAVAAATAGDGNDRIGLGFPLLLGAALLGGLLYRVAPRGLGRPGPPDSAG